MNRLQFVLGAIANELEAAGRDWALLGGLAVSVYVPPRFTRDVYVAVAVDRDAQAERLVHRLQRAGYGVGMVLVPVRTQDQLDVESSPPRRET